MKKKTLFVLVIASIIGATVSFADTANTVPSETERGIIAIYKTIESGVVAGYKSVENFFVSWYQAIENRFVMAFLTTKKVTDAIPPDSI
jgi:hypothetical protein